MPVEHMYLLACLGIALKVHGVAGDDEARNRGTQKSVLERQAPATFPVVIEMRERAFWVTHWTEDSVDCVLHGKDPTVQVGILSARTAECVEPKRFNYINLAGPRGAEF